MSDSNEAGSSGTQLGWPALSRVRQILTVQVRLRTSRVTPSLPAVTAETLRKLSVLVVDDVPQSQRWVCELLVSLGISPLLAADGEQAVAVAKRRRLDLILMDIQMPVLDGPGATRMIRQHETEVARRRVPVVAYTSIGAHAAHVRDSGMDGVLHKPCNPFELHACLAQWCAPPRRQPSRTALAFSGCR